MTEFDKAVKSIKTCLFWDFADGQWLDTLYTPLDRDFFNRLMQGVVDAHEAENAKLRELVRDMYKIISALDIDYCGTCPQDNVSHPCPQYTIYGGDCKYAAAMRELGVEVDR